MHECVMSKFITRKNNSNIYFLIALGSCNKEYAVKRKILQYITTTITNPIYQTRILITETQELEFKPAPSPLKHYLLQLKPVYDQEKNILKSDSSPKNISPKVKTIRTQTE